MIGNFVKDAASSRPCPRTSPGGTRTSRDGQDKRRLSTPYILWGSSTGFTATHWSVAGYAPFGSGEAADLSYTVLSARDMFSSLLRILARLMGRMMGVTRLWFQRRQVKAQLRALSDEQLKDIGIMRWEIRDM